MYKCKHVRSGIVTFVEAKCLHCHFMKEHDGVPEYDSVDKLYEYKNCDAVKNFIG